MKFASYLLNGKEAFGAVIADDVVTLSDSRYPTLRDAIAGNVLTELATIAAGKKPDRKLKDVELLPVLTNSEKIICIGLNYKSHADEGNNAVPEDPSLFFRLANTLVPHNGDMIRPKVSTRLDFEGELAVIIGKPGRHIAKADALSHIAGYSCFVDGSVRDFQKHSVTAGKNFVGTGPFGPWMVTADEIPDPTKLTLVTRLNGQEMQRSGTDMLVYSIPVLIAYISSFTPLAAGDVIATGTPAGVGHRRNPQVWMKAGDVLEVEISKIGTLRSGIVDEN